ncbi:hypothetical protein PROFUN_02943 [Planoprotostelium fungivorum]|uniref:Uncharacterized protein n=1 Tax=Planoprotostelium fungivorum TaxID=1890364 RepID=A0A2P6NX49_9EUKA|nr:hypothetical protein PROFUN_02943 [Planoprotostelium fungivorum]
MDSEQEILSRRLRKATPFRFETTTSLQERVAIVFPSSHPLFGEKKRMSFTLWNGNRLAHLERNGYT